MNYDLLQEVHTIGLGVWKLIYFILDEVTSPGTKFELVLPKKHPNKVAEIAYLDLHSCFEPRRK